MALNSHTLPQKQFILRMLAQLMPPRDVALAFATVYPDTKCTEQDVLSLDPRVGITAPDLVEYFWQEHDRALADPRLATFASQAARILSLSQQAQSALNDRRLGDARSIFRQIAEEQGVDAKGGKGDGGPAGGEPVEAIEITIIDPKPREVPNGNPAANPSPARVPPA